VIQFEWLGTHLLRGHAVRRCYLGCKARLVAGFVLMGWAFLASGADKATSLEIGIAPFLPVQTLIKNYRPMQLYLERRLRVPVTFVTAPDYKTFNERTLRHEYPLIITVANSAYLAYADAGYVPLLRPVVYTRPVLVVRKGQTLARIEDLRGKTVAMPDVLAVVSMQGMQMLREAGLDPGQDVMVKNLPNHAAAVNYVIAGEMFAAIVSDRALAQMLPEVRAAVRVAASWDKGAVPGVLYLASPDLSPGRVEELKRTISNFAMHTQEGRALMDQLGYGGLVPANVEVIRPLAPYGEQLRHTMSELH
jgi:phosphonate transport system substrate-binding protein